MLVTILPFLLAARLNDSLDESSWNGFETVYDVTVNMTIADSDLNFCSAIGTELMCRAKGSDTLSCRLMLTPDTAFDPHCKDYRKGPSGLVTQEPFEVRFHTRGVENLVVRRNISRWQLDFIKAIVTQLHLGIDLDSRRPNFVTMENSTSGYCEVGVRVVQGRELDEELLDRDFEILFVPSRERYSLEDNRSVIIQKVRDPEKCPGRPMYFFGKHESYEITSKRDYVFMSSSISRTVISSKRFSSFTSSEGILKTNDLSKSYKPYQKIELNLKTIRSVRSEIPDIPHPASTGLHAFSNFE